MKKTVQMKKKKNEFMKSMESMDSMEFLTTK